MNMETAPLEAVVDEAIESAHDGRVTLRDLFEAWGDRSYGPLFIILGFVGGTPLAVVPLAAAVVGAVIAVIALQMALGKAHPWLPDFILERSVSKDKLQSVRDKASPTLEFIDRLITERWSLASNAAVRRVAALAVAILGLLMIPFDLVPFAVAAPSWAVVLFGVAITARDGLVMTLAAIATFGVAYLGFTIVA